MLIYIPSHLENIKIVSQLSSLIKSYSESYSENPTSFENYYYSYISDPVKKFLGLCLSNENISSLNNQNDVIDYLMKLFYSVKGTIKVFSLMKEYLNIKFKGDIIYTVDEIRFEIDEVTTLNILTYINSLRDFLDSLLYYNDIKYTIDTINLIINNKISNSYSPGLIMYKEFIITEKL